jgi:histidine triad (HIT) family protein
MKKDNCILCGIIENKIPSYKVYEDDKVLAVLDVNGSNVGHCFVIPKNHYPIIEQVPDDELINLFSVANKVSSSIFDALKVQGTNIYVSNGIPAGQTIAHFMINVIPRKENDNINLQWKPKQLTEEEMSTVELKLKEQLTDIGIQKISAPSSQKSGTIKEEAASGYISDDDEDFMMQHINRIP